MKAKEMSIGEFLNVRFPDEKAAVDFFIEKRWGGAISCPYCNCAKVYTVKTKQPYKCAACRRKFTARTGTIMEGSHVPVRMWLFCMYLMATSRKGVSSVELAKQLGVTQKTAWFMAHRIREACDETGKLSGTVETDEVYIGPRVKSMHLAERKAWKGRGVANKVPVVGMKERGGRTIARVVNSTGNEAPSMLIREYVRKGSTIMTDESPLYASLKYRGYKHGVVNHSRGKYVDGSNHTNSIESVWAVLRRGMYGTYHHIDKKHLQRYVDEFAFRISRPYALDFITSVCENVGSGAVQYSYLTR